MARFAQTLHLRNALILSISNIILFFADGSHLMAHWLRYEVNSEMRCMDLVCMHVVCASAAVQHNRKKREVDAQNFSELLGISIVAIRKLPPLSAKSLQMPQGSHTHTS